MKLEKKNITQRLCVNHDATYKILCNNHDATSKMIIIYYLFFIAQISNQLIGLRYG